MTNVNLSTTPKNQITPEQKANAARVIGIDNEKRDIAWFFLKEHLWDYHPAKTKEILERLVLDYFGSTEDEPERRDSMKAWYQAMSSLFGIFNKLKQGDISELSAYVKSPDRVDFAL